MQLSLTSSDLTSSDLSNRELQSLRWQVEIHFIRSRRRQASDGIF